MTSAYSVLLRIILPLILRSWHPNKGHFLYKRKSLFYISWKFKHLLNLWPFLKSNLPYMQPFCNWMSIAFKFCIFRKAFSFDDLDKPNGFNWFSVCRNSNNRTTCKKINNRSGHVRCSMQKVVLRNFTKLTGKHLCQSLCPENVNQQSNNSIHL